VILRPERFEDSESRVLTPHLFVIQGAHPMKRAISACFVLLIFASVSLGQKKDKPWTDWSKKDVEKTLNDSAWGQTQSEGGSEAPTQTSAITQVSAPGTANRGLNSSGESGESKPSRKVKYFVRFLSAKPVRAAFARQVQLARPEPNEELNAQLQAFVDRTFADYIVVSVGVEVGDEKMATPIAGAFTNAKTEALQKTVYLERQDGKKLFLLEYRAPAGDGMGAKFIFQRAVDGQPFLTEKDSVKFVAQLNERMKLNTRYKLSDMLYDGKVEY
jgi:hypothetical protein